MFDLAGQLAATAGGSLSTFGRARSQADQPLDDIAFARPCAFRHVERSPTRVLRLPVQVCTSAEEDLRSATLPTVARVPEGLRDVLGTAFSFVCEQFLQASEHSERCCMPERIYPGATDYQKASHIPTAVPDRIVERRADRPVWNLQIGTGVYEHSRHIIVVAAGTPVKWCLPVIHVGASIHVGSGFDGQARDTRTVREVAGPVRDDMQRRATLRNAAES